MGDGPVRGGWAKGWRSVTDLRTERGTEPPPADDPPRPPEFHERPPDDPPSAVPARSGAVQLTRLTALARLSAAQAVEVAAGVLAEAAARPEPGPGEPVGDPLPIDRVVIGADGWVALGPAVDGRSGADRSTAGSGVAAVLAHVADAARLPAGGAGPAAEQLLAQLDRGGADLPGTGGRPAAPLRERAAAASDRPAGPAAP